MLTKITDGWWIDIKEIVNFSNDAEGVDITFRNSKNTVKGGENFGKLLEQKLKEIYGEKEQKNNIVETLLLPTEELDVLARTVNCLRAEGFKFIGDIVCHDNLDCDWRGSMYQRLGELLKTPNFSKKSYRDLIAALMKINLLDFIECPEYWIKRKEICGNDFENEHFPFK